MENNTGIQYAGEYDLTELKLFTSSGAVIDLRPMYLALNLYENMFSNTLSGTLMFTDTNSLVVNAPIVGQEFLSFQIKTPSLDSNPIDFTKNVMAVHRIDMRVIERGNEVVQLHFCSPELLRNDRTRLSKKFEGNISDIVDEILNDKVTVNTRKKIFIENTKGIKKIIVPNKNPYSLIRDLTTDAISETGSPNYVFFENIDGFHFRTLDSLYGEGVKGEFIASDKGSIDFKTGGVSNIEEDLKRVLQYDIASNNDTKENIKSGMLASKSISYNMYQKNYDVQRYDYFSDFDKYKRVSNGESDNPIYNDAPIDEFDNNLGDFKDARIFMHSTSKDSSNLDTQHYVDSKTNFTPNDVSKTIQHRFAKNTELDYGVKVNMEINGNTTIKTGSVIDFQIPIVGNTHGDVFDKYNSGKFLITKTRHEFSKLGTRYKIYLSAIKDSLNSQLPSGEAEAQQPISRR